MAAIRKSKCPSCQKPGAWLDTPSAPFCCERCRLIDLGKWLGEENRISEPLPPEKPLGDADSDG